MSKPWTRNQRLAAWGIAAVLVAGVLAILPDYVPRLPKPDLKLVSADQSQSEPNTVDLMFKNSGDDAALLKSIRFGIRGASPSFYYPRPTPTPCIPQPCPPSPPESPAAPVMYSTYHVEVSVGRDRLILLSKGPGDKRAVSAKGSVLPIAVEVPAHGTAGLKIVFKLPRFLRPREIRLRWWPGDVETGPLFHDAPESVTKYRYSMALNATIEYDEYGSLRFPIYGMQLSSPDQLAEDEARP